MGSVSSVPNQYHHRVINYFSNQQPLPSFDDKSENYLPQCSGDKARPENSVSTAEIQNN